MIPTRWSLRRAFSAVLAAACAGPALGSAVPATAQTTAAVSVTRNFYGPETWEPGKDRRWMRNNGEIELSSDAAMDVDLRFMAESFHRSRALTVFVGGVPSLTLLIPASASRYVVVKHVRIPAGNVTVRFDAAPGPVRVNEIVTSGDNREVSVAFGPFSTVASASPEGQIEQTGAFPEARTHLSYYTPEEEEANDLRRQGRLLEALARYRALTSGPSANQPSYVWAGLCALTLGAPDEAQGFFRASRQGQGSSTVRSYANQAATQLDAFVAKSELLRRPDPVSGLRSSGEIYLAVPEYLAVLRAHPDDAVAHLWLGIIYAVAERLLDARNHFERVIQAAPDTYDAQFLRTLLKSSGQ